MLKRLRMPLLIGALGLVAFPVVSFTTGANDICTIRTDADGNCWADLADVVPAQLVVVEGIVEAWHHYGTRGPGAIIDPTTGCCISVFDIEAVNIPIGHLVQIEGWVTQFSGLDEISDNPADGGQDPLIIDLGFVGEPACNTVSGADLQDHSAVAERMESCLVSLCGRFLAQGDFETFSANYDFLAEDGNIVEVRIDSDTDIAGTPIPGSPVTVCGVLAQFDGFNAEPCTGYQVLPRFLADIAPSSLCDPVPNQTTTWGQIKSITR